MTVLISLSDPFSPGSEVWWGNVFVPVTRDFPEDGVVRLIRAEGGPSCLAIPGSTTVLGPHSVECGSDRILRPVAQRVEVFRVCLPVSRHGIQDSFFLALQKESVRLLHLLLCQGSLGIHASLVTSASWQWMME